MMDDIKLINVELSLLRQYVENIGRICFQYMPPAGQDEMRRAQDGYYDALEAIAKAHPKEP